MLVATRCGRGRSQKIIFVLSDGPEMCPSRSIGFMDGVEKLRKGHSPSLRIESRA